MRGLQSRLDNVVKPGRWAMRYRFGLIVVATVVVSVGMGGVMARAAVRPAVVADPASAVDMRVMTTGGGNDFPGAAVPPAWAPQRRPRGGAGAGSWAQGGAGARPPAPSSGAPPPPPPPSPTWFPPGGARQPRRSRPVPTRCS